MKQAEKDLVTNTLKDVVGILEKVEVDEEGYNKAVDDLIMEFTEARKKTFTFEEVIEMLKGMRK